MGEDDRCDVGKYIMYVKVCTSHRTLVTVSEKKPIINKHGHFPKGWGARATTILVNTLPTKYDDNACERTRGRRTHMIVSIPVYVNEGAGGK